MVYDPLMVYSVDGWVSPMLKATVALTCHRMCFFGA
jgi:hypothetical protein